MWALHFVWKLSRLQWKASVIMNHDDTYIKQRSTALQVMKTYMRHLDFPTTNYFTTLIFLLTFMFMYTYAKAVGNRPYSPYSFISRKNLS